MQGLSQKMQTAAYLSGFTPKPANRAARAWLLTACRRDTHRVTAHHSYEQKPQPEIINENNNSVDLDLRMV